MQIFAAHALLPTGWANNVLLTVEAGRIAVLEVNAAPPPGAHRTPCLVPAPGTVHSHSLQRILPDLAIRAGSAAGNTPANLMARCLAMLTPQQVQTIAAMHYIELLEAGLASIGEFQTLHHAPSGQPYDDPAELSRHFAAAAGETGIGLALLPVLTQPDHRRPGIGAPPQRSALDLPRYDALIGSVRPTRRDDRIAAAALSLEAISMDALTDLTTLLPEAPLHLPIAATRTEVVAVLATHGATPVKWLLEIMDVDPRWCLIHAAVMSPAETRALAYSGAVVGVCPPLPGAPAGPTGTHSLYRESGGRLGLGTGWLPTPDIARMVTGVLDPADLDAAAIPRSLASLAQGSAQALGRGPGTLSPGAWADCAAFDPGPMPADNAVARWLSGTPTPIITDVWSAGRHAVRAGRHIARPAIETRYRNTVTAVRQSL